jgi:protein required for attachment to host cells
MGNLAQGLVDLVWACQITSGNQGASLREISNKNIWSLSMLHLKLFHGDWVFVGDGQKALFLINEGDEKSPNLRRLSVLESPDPPSREQGSDAPGRAYSSVGEIHSAVEETDWHELQKERFAVSIAEIDGEVLMDGAIANNTPILAAAKLGASRIIVLPTGYACALKEPPKGAIAKALHAITLLIAGQLIRDFERLADEVHVCIVPTLCPLAISPYDFSTSVHLIRRTAASTRKWLSRGGLSLRSPPLELQAHNH